MISVSEADRLIGASLPEASVTRTALDSAETPGRILCQDVLADRPLPPFHRVTMDGIAVRAAEVAGGRRQFSVAGIQQAGQPRLDLEDPRTCLEVMTGAVLPGGTDAVIPYEEIDIVDGMAILSSAVRVEEMKNVHQKGSDVDEGIRLLQSGARLNGPLCGIAASVGCGEPEVRRTPTVGLVSTGDELVPVQTVPLEHQIRDSNTRALQASLRLHGIHDIRTRHLRDQQEDIREGLAGLLEERDVVVLTGGVSMGKFDLIPEVLQELGIRQIFHKIRQRPGKPLWFGQGERGQLVFGLPGNPVSSLIGLHRYVLPALAGLSGEQPGQPRARLLADHSFQKKMTLFLPVRVEFSPDGVIGARPVVLNGSGDFASLAASDGFIQLPEDQVTFRTGEAWPLWLWNGGLV